MADSAVLLDKKELSIALSVLINRCLAYRDWDNDSASKEELEKIEIECREQIKSSMEEVAARLNIPLVSLPFYSEWPIFTYEGSTLYKEAMNNHDNPVS